MHISRVSQCFTVIPAWEAQVLPLNHARNQANDSIAYRAALSPEILLKSMLSPAVHESRDEPADVAVREPPRGRRDEPDVQVERVGRVGVPEEHRNRLYVPPPPRARLMVANVWRKA